MHRCQHTFPEVCHSNCHDTCNESSHHRALYQSHSTTTYSTCQPLNALCFHVIHCNHCTAPTVTHTRWSQLPHSSIGIYNAFFHQLRTPHTLGHHLQPDGCTRVLCTLLAGAAVQQLLSFSLSRVCTCTSTAHTHTHTPSLTHTSTAAQQCQVSHVVIIIIINILFLHTLPCLLPFLLRTTLSHLLNHTLNHNTKLST